MLAAETFLMICVRPALIRTAAALLLAPLALAASAVLAQAPHTLTPEEHAKVESILSRMTPEQKIDYIGGTGFAVRAVPELGLKAWEMSDGPYGVRSNAGFPSNTYVSGIGLAATWDREMGSRVGEGIGRDARARGIHYMLGPGVNIYRSPRNGRNFEYLGEDPYLASEMVVGYITGMQQQGVSATVKHFLGNNSEFLRHDSDSIIDERALREIYLPAFHAAVTRGHVGAIMDSYNLINGQHATQNGYFNTEIVRKEWHFPGTMMSDWDATYDGVAAANGGLDLEMPTGKFMNRANLLPALKDGRVSQATIDDKVRHILDTAMMFGWFDRDQHDPSISTDDQAGRKTALDAARESVVLLKNQGNVLPLDPGTVKTVLLVGPDAYPGAPVGGGSAGVVPFHNVSIVEGLQQVFGPNVNVLYEPGLPKLSDLARQTDFTTEENGGKPGLTLEVFHSNDLSGDASTSVAPHVDRGGLSWESLADDPELAAKAFNGKPQPESFRYTGYFNAKEAGDYIVAFAGSGEGTGDRVIVDGKTIIDDWTLVRALEPHVTLPLSAGPHKIVVETWQRGILGGRARLAIVPANSIVNERAVQMAAKADAVIVAAGFTNTKDYGSESEGGDRTFDLPYGQDQLISAMAKVNPKTVVTVTSGGGFNSQAWLDQVPALLENWYPGEEGGRAIAEILAGKVDPSGHLPATFERRAEDNPTFANYYPAPGTNKVEYKEGIFVGYRGYEHNHVQPLFPFGYGLSYTSFRFSGLHVSHGGTMPATVTFTVTNTGKVAGAEVAQVYVSDHHTRVPRPERELKGFERLSLAPGESKVVTVKLPANAFAYYDVAAKKWTVEPGRFIIHVGDSVESLPLSAPLEVTRAAAANLSQE